MNQNKYDQPEFFAKYSDMARSRLGLEGAGEWPAMQRLLPDFAGKRVLDLGCGFGWHCRYAVEHGAVSAVGVDLSKRMLQRARALTDSDRIRYQRLPIEEIAFPPDAFDVVISSLALHYVPSFAEVCRRVRACLTPGGWLVFSVEHPVFTAQGTQEWVSDADGSPLHWPVDRYFEEGVRSARFLGEEVRKFHRTLTTYVGALLENGFSIEGLVEPQPTEEALAANPGMREELRRPMMLIIAARRVAQ